MEVVGARRIGATSDRHCQLASVPDLFCFGCASGRSLVAVGRVAGMARPPLVVVTDCRGGRPLCQRDAIFHLHRDDKLALLFGGAARLCAFGWRPVFSNTISSVKNPT